MAGIFISYRRDDAAGYAGRIYDQLSEDFGDAQVFMDVDAIDPGVDFVKRIESAVASSDVFLAVVGRNWVSATDAQGQRRLDDPDDYVRREVAAALQRRRMTVIPVLVAGAVMPAAKDLPAELAPMTRINALVLSDVEWRAGIARLVSTVKKSRRPPPERPLPVAPKPPDGKPEPVDKTRLTPLLLIGLAGVGLLAAATALRLDELVNPDFGGGTVPKLGTVVAPASILLPLAALYAVLKAWRSAAGPLATGLLLGFGLGGVAKYVALVGQRATSDRPEVFGSATALWLGLAGSVVVTGAAAYWLVVKQRQRRTPSSVVGRFFAPIGALAMAVATFIPFNVSFPDSNPTQVVIIERSGWEAFEPLAVAVMVVALVFAGSAVKQLVVSGVFIALGLLSALFWLRYVGVPILQMLQEDDLAEIRAGGFVGLAGAVIVWRAGVAGRDSVLKSERPPAS